MSKDLISLQHHLTYNVLGTDQQLEQAILLTLKADDTPPQKRAPLSLMLCIDVSGSMMGKPLQLLVESVKMLIEQLSEHDRLGMVTFSSRSKLISPVRYLNDRGKGFFNGVLQSIQALGSTHLESGLNKVFDSLPTVRSGELTHIVLLSDGKPNRGAIETKQLLEIMDNCPPNWTMSSFGYGVKHDEDLLESLARKGGGGYAYVESAEMAPVAFAKELGSLFSTVGTNIQLLLQPEKGCTIRQIRGGRTITYSSVGMQVEIADMIAGQQAHFLFDLQQETISEPGIQNLMNVELRYIVPGQPPQQVSKVQRLNFKVAKNPTLFPNPRVQARCLLEEISKAWKEAHQFAVRRAFNDAVKHLEPYLQKLKKYWDLGETKSEVHDWYEQIVDEIEILNQRPSEERYQKVRKAALSEMPDPTGSFRRGNTSMVNLNTTQRHLLSEMMLKAVGMPHAHLILTTVPKESKLKKKHIFPVLGETSIGRLGQIKLDHPSVSKRHVRLVATPAGYLLLDLLSTNSPKINQVAMKRPTLLKNEDEIQLGVFVLTFRTGIAPSLKAT